MIDKPSTTARRNIPIDWLVEYLCKRGINSQAIATFLGRDQLILDDGPVVSVADYLALLNWASEKLGDDCLGVSMAQDIAEEEMGLLGYIVANCTTVGEAVEFVQRYHDIFSPEFSYRLEDHGDIQRLVYHGPSNQYGNPIHDIVFSVGMSISGFRYLWPENTPLRSCSFSFSEPVELECFRQFFGEKLNFDQPENFVEFESRLLEKENSEQDKTLLPILLQQANYLMSRMGAEEDLVQKLQLLLTASLEYEVLTTEKVAQHLNMTVRSLHRYLTQRGTSFRKIREEVIVKVAKEALLETDLSITEIAVKLNYSEASAFGRVFKRAVGVSPLAYRQQHKRP